MPDKINKRIPEQIAAELSLSGLDCPRLEELVARTCKLVECQANNGGIHSQIGFLIERLGESEARECIVEALAANPPRLSRPKADNAPRQELAGMIAMSPQPLVIDGAVLADWLDTFPELAGFYIIGRDNNQDCCGESKLMAMVDIENDPRITTDPASLAALDVIEHQRGDYHHLRLDHVLDFALKHGVISSSFVVVHYSW